MQNFDVPIILPLSSDDVKDKDYIIVMGLYNENRAFESQYGSTKDLYPTNNTYCGRFNQMIKRIREELAKSRNNKCQIILAGPHCFGKYPYNDKDAYHYAGLSDSLNVLCEHNNIAYCELMRSAGIDSTNWCIYQSGGYVTDDPKANPHITDNLHLNKRGQMKVAVAIAKWMGKTYKGI